MFPSRLAKVALFGGFFVVGTAKWMENRIQLTFRKEDYYQKPVSMLQKYEAGAEILGRPIFSGNLNLGDENKTKVDGLTARLSVPVKGSKDKGTLHIKASRETYKDKWEIDELDLEVPSRKQRWKFYDRHMVQPKPEKEITTEEVVSLPT